MISQNSSFPTEWEVLTPPDRITPDPLYLRAQTLPARSYFARHSHDWHQLVYATEGTLSVDTDAARHLISPAQAVWLPAGVAHSVGTYSGARFRSLYVARSLEARAQHVCDVSDLMRELVLELARIEAQGERGAYRDQLVSLLLSQITRSQTARHSLPWPAHKGLAAVCRLLLDDPADKRTIGLWAKAAGLSPRSFMRHFSEETGLSYRDWRNRLRVMRAMELLDAGTSVTQTAFLLGYGAPSAFVHMFRRSTGATPLAYRQARASLSGVRPEATKSP